MALFGFLNRAHIGSIEWRAVSYRARIIAKSSSSVTTGLGRVSDFIPILYFPVPMHSCKAVEGSDLTALRPDDPAAIFERLF